MMIDDDDDVLDLIRLSQSGCEQSCADAPVMFHHLYIDMPVAFKQQNSIIWCKMWMRLATGHKRMQPTNPLLWRHQATGDPSKDLQQGVPAEKRFCLWFQVSWIFFCFVWFFNWCLHFFQHDVLTHRMGIHTGKVNITWSWLKLNVLIEILVERGILFFWAMLHIFAFFVFFSVSLFSNQWCYVKGRIQYML